jgi:TolB protein
MDPKQVHFRKELLMTRFSCFAIVGICSAATILLAQGSEIDKAAKETPFELVFSVKTWEGEYFSKDIPGGVQTSPVVGAIWSVGGDGKGLRKIVQLGKNTDYPHFSPDGKWVYFQSNATGKSQVYRCQPDGSNVVNLTAGDKLGKWKEAYGYNLGADGKKMIFTVHDGSSGRVALADVDGSEPRLIAPSLGYIYMAALSPTSDRVVFSGPARGYRLMLAELPDGKPLLLTPNHPESFVPKFTPDGKTIVFFRRDGDVYRVDADGTNLKRLTQGNNYVHFRLSSNDRHASSDGPHVSPDGKRIAYIAVKDGVPNVGVMNLDGSEQKQLTFRKTPCGRVRFRPDSKQIAFVSFVDKYPQLFVVPAAGGEPRQLTKMDGAVYFVDWRP